MNTCDVCQVAKAVWVAVLQRKDDKDLHLYFCNHHYNQHGKDMRKKGFLLVKT